jgi:hypothetical protein
MTDSYVQTPEEKIDDLARDVFVAGHLARDRRLTPDYADALAFRVRKASTDMIEPADVQLLAKTADRLESASIRIKSGNLHSRVELAATGPRPRVKAAPAPRPQPDIAAMNLQADLEQVFAGDPFDRDEFEAVERERIAEANRQLAERNRAGEEERRR